MHREMLGFWGVFVAAAGFVGCGGKVVIDAEGAGGQGGTSSSTNGTSVNVSSVNGTTSVASTAAGGDPKTLCEQACDAMNKVPDCMQPECVSSCIQEFEKAGACVDLFLSVVGCVIDNAGVGGVCSGEPCQASSDAYVDCISGSCSMAACSGGEPCECSGSCFGKQVSTMCFSSPDGSAKCVCKVSGMEVGQCQSQPGEFACALQFGCCSQFF